MAKFLVLARPKKPLPQKANVEGARAQWRALRDEGRAEVYEIVEPGQISPDEVVTPGPFVQRLVQRPPDFSAYQPLEE